MYAHHIYDKTASILGYTPGTGWGDEDSYVVSQEVPCRIRPLAGNERFLGGKVTLIASHRVYCPVIDVTEADRIEIDDVTYIIELVNRPSESEHLELDVLRVQ